MKTIITFFVKNRLFGDLLSVFIIIIGIASVLLIRREVFPNVSFDTITVTTIFPGASSLETEKLISSPLEQDLQEIDGIKKLRSNSSENRSFIVVQLDPDQTTEEEAKSDITEIIDAFEVPDGAEDPLVKALKSKQQPIIEVSLAANMTEFELREYARELEREIERVPGVARVVFKGLNDLEIRIEADPEKLLQYNITLDEIIRAVDFQNVTIPAGVIEDNQTDVGTKEKIIRTVGEFEDEEDVKNTVIRANELGQSIRVEDIANVYMTTANASILNRTNGKPAISLTVLKKEISDAINVVDLVKERASEYLIKNKQISLSYINDFSTFIRRRVSILANNMLVGLFLVVIILALFLPFRVALVCSLGIVIAFLGTMWMFYLNGHSINLISLLGLIIVSGMLVDDAVVVSDNIVRHMEDGDPPEEAAIKGAYEIWPSITASILTTVIAFLPMMFMSGIFGKFVKQIPLGVVIALLFSLFEGLLLLPQHMGTYVTLKSLKPPTSKFSPRFHFQRFWDNKFLPVYLNAVNKIISYRYIAASAVLIFFVTTMIVAKNFLPFILFPPEGIENFFIRIKTPTGYSLENSLRVIKPLEKLVASLPERELKDYVTTVGLIQQDPNDPNTKRGSEYIQIAVFLTPENDRERVAFDIIEDLKKRAVKTDEMERLTFERVNPGPPTGKPISVAVRGEDYENILRAINELKPKVEKIEGALDITNSFSPGKDEIQLVVDKSEAAAAGLTVAQIGTTVRSSFDGTVATTIQNLDEEIDIRVNLPKEDRGQIETLSKIRIPNALGYQIPLLNLAKIVRSRGIANYEHENNRREVRITGEVDTKVASSIGIAEQIKENIFPEIRKKYPDLIFTMGGEDEDTQESLASLVRAFVIAVMGIFLLLVLTFKNLSQPFLVLLTIPLGILAVIWTLIISGNPLSFLAGLGIVALAGVIVNNAIVLIDFVNIGRGMGLDRFASIERAVKLRVRPIFLTTLTTVAGLLPTAHGIGGLDKFVVPIALSLGYGILFGAILTAFIFPCAIAILDDIKLKLGMKV